MRPFCFRSYRPAFSGYGYGTNDFVESFRRNNWRFTFQPDALEKAEKCREEVVIHSGFPHFYRLEPGKIHIARVMLESDSLPRLWADVLNSMDEVWVASSFNVETFADGGVNRRKIFVIPDMVDPRFSPPPHPRAPRKKFRFLSVFLDLSLRKGWDVMLYEFAANFSGAHDVEWVVQCSPDSARRLKEVIKEVNRRGHKTGNITVRGEIPSIPELVKLYRSADCYVLPTRGEGFGRPYLEAAACGVPVIATGWGGQLDFLNRRNSRLLKYTLVDVPAPEALDCYFLACQRWAEPSHGDLGTALRRMPERPALRPVDCEPFREKNVLALIEARLGAVKKRPEKRRDFSPQIIVYDRGWKARQLSPRGFARELNAAGKKIAVAGTGRNAASLSRFLAENGFTVPFYIDRKPGRFMGKKVLSPDGLPANARADMVLISCFPAAFAEWVAMLDGRWKLLPVIFYSRRG